MSASRRAARVLVALALATLAAVAVPALADRGSSAWTRDELAVIRSLWIGSLDPLPPDPTNRVADDDAAAELGHAVFFDTRFSATGTVGCATCHQPERNFTDGLPLARGVGDVPRKSMTITGTAYGPWLFWDGRADSQWAQALGPLENPDEHGIDRGTVAHLVAEHHRDAYESVFGPLPDLEDAVRFPRPAGPVEDRTALANWNAMRADDRDAVTAVFVNVGKAIAAYERRIQPGPAPFDRFAEALIAGDARAAAVHLDRDAIAGLRLFIGPARCVDCHNGPLFTNDAFHNTGVPRREGRPADVGRAEGAHRVLHDPFNCLGAWSDNRAACAELRFLRIDDHVLEGAFKTPTLRNVAEAAPYMHAGQFTTLADAIAHYASAPPAAIGHTEVEPLDLTPRQAAQLEAFLRSLSGPLAAPASFLRPPPSGRVMQATADPARAEGSP